MMSNKFCPQCGTLVTDELPGGLCPTCLMAAAKQSQPDVPETFAPSRTIEAPTIAQMSELFPEYEVLELVGRGGMGAVYKAMHRNLDRLVAIKIFLFRADDPEFTQRFAREARTLAKLDHPNIIRIYDFGERTKLHYLVMEYIDGLNLRQVSSASKLTPAEAIALIPQLCDALQYAHDKRVVHRDIKPENILMAKDGRLKIADFGLAKITGSKESVALTRTQQVMGTLNYMAPEQMERPMEVDHRADIYSLGVVIYELLTGELPIGRFQPPSKKVEVDIRLDEVVLRALEKEPELRYQNASDFKTSFSNFDSYPHAAPVHAKSVGFVPVAPVKPVKAQHDSDSELSDSRRGELGMVLFKGLAMFVCLLCPIVFILGSDEVRYLEEDISRLAGIAVAMAGGFLFAISGFVRVIFGVPPEDIDELKDYHASTKLAAGIRIFAMFFGFATGIIFVARSMLQINQAAMMVAGITTAVICGGLFMVSGSVDQFLKPESNNAKKK